MKSQSATKIIKRRQKKIFGVFIDGVGLDRATRRINRKVDISALLRGVTAGGAPTVARYYTIIPFEDDSRHRAFLDAVERAGLSVSVKRLPPIGVARQVSVDVDMAADIVAFASGKDRFQNRDLIEEEEPRQFISPALPGGARVIRANETFEPEAELESSELTEDEPGTKRVVVIVCPSRDLAYPIGLAGQLGADTVSADFGGHKNSDVLKSAAKWIDLGDSETIWKE